MMRSKHPSREYSLKWSSRGEGLGRLLCICVSQQLHTRMLLNCNQSPSCRELNQLGEETNKEVSGAVMGGEGGGADSH